MSVVHRAIWFALMVGAVSPAAAFPWYAQGENFRGAQLMSADERSQHVARLQTFKSFAECKDYMQAHHLELERRAQASRTALPPVQGDPCEVMKRMGRIR